MEKKRNYIETEPVDLVKRPCYKSPKREKDVLNDGLINLYKKEQNLKKENSSSSQDSPNPENKSKEGCTCSSKALLKSSKKIKNAAFTPVCSTVNLSNVGGLDKHLETILRAFTHYELLQPLYKNLHIKPEPGILLHGPPGCGKTHLARAIAGQVNVPIIELAATEIVGGISGESEKRIRDAFAAALAAGRCILFIDEIEAICSKRETSENALQGRMVSQMIKSFDELRQKDPDCEVVVIGATNRIDSIDSALRRGSRFTYEIDIGFPTEEERLSILKVICKNLTSSDVDLQWLAHHTPGYTGADLNSLSNIARLEATKRILKYVPPDGNMNRAADFKHPSESQHMSAGRGWISQYFEFSDCLFEEGDCKLDDFKAALQKFVPSCKREGFSSVPDTTWDEVGSYEEVKAQLRRNILLPVLNRKLYEINKVPTSRGVLLYGPKGCGKTLLAKALANECNISFIAIKGPQLLNKYVGESEKAIRNFFEKAQNSAPCIIFFDEFDALCPSRTNSKENGYMERVVNQLLTETSGIQVRKQVFLIAATNRLDKIDSAMLRPGRLDKVIYVGLPTPAGRLEILKNHLKDKILEEGLDLEKIAFDLRCKHFSGADIFNLVHEAFVNSAEELTYSDLKVEDKMVLCARHFDTALSKIKPSISKEERRYYERMQRKHSRI